MEELQQRIADQQRIIERQREAIRLLIEEGHWSPLFDALRTCSTRSAPWFAWGRFASHTSIRRRWKWPLVLMSVATLSIAFVVMFVGWGEKDVLPNIEEKSNVQLSSTTATRGEPFFSDQSIVMTMIDHESARPIEHPPPAINETLTLPPFRFAVPLDQRDAQRSLTRDDERKALQVLFDMYDNVTNVQDIELIQSTPPVFLYQKSTEAIRTKWEALEAAHGGGLGRRVVNIACLYAGFTRDMDRMFRSCREHRPKVICTPNVIKFFGNQRGYLLEPSQCDVFVSTWDIIGGGRFSINRYNMRDVVGPQAVTSLFKGRIAGLHVQNYTYYEQVWRYMHHFSHAFPQTRPTASMANAKIGAFAFRGRPETNYFLRLNDYSQSYKQWCVAQLALLSQHLYDVFFRMRFDVRSTAALVNWRFAVTPAGQRVVAFDIVRDGKILDAAAEGEVPVDHMMHIRSTPETTHYVSGTRIHAANFDISDFAFAGPPQMVAHLATLWYFCLQPPSAMSPVRGAQAVTTAHISEYNYMVWRAIFDNKWEVDSGGGYLRISRRWGVPLPPSDASGSTGTERRVVFQYRTKRIRKVV